MNEEIDFSQSSNKLKVQRTNAQGARTSLKLRGSENQRTKCTREQVRTTCGLKLKRRTDFIYALRFYE